MIENLNAPICTNFRNSFLNKFILADFVKKAIQNPPTQYISG